MNRKRYCGIIKCPNNRGTFEILSRLPKRPKILEKWVNAIQKFQGAQKRSGHLCRLHFEPESIIELEPGRWKVKEGTVPTIFNGVRIDLSDDESLDKREIITDADVEAIIEVNEEIAPEDDDQQESYKPLDSSIITFKEIEEDNVEPETQNTSYIGPQFCYICSMKSDFYYQNLYETVSKYTKTRVCDFIKRWLDESPSTREIDSSDENFVCVDCFDKINEYDLACETAKRIDKELRDSFMKNESILISGDGKRVADIEITDELPEFLLDPDAVELEEQYINVLDEKSSFEIENKGKTKIDEKFFECIKCPSQVPAHEYEKHLMSHMESADKYKCAVCNLEFKDDEQFSEHFQLHKQYDQLQCVICKREFENRNLLVRHTYKIHSDRMPAPCERCGKIVNKLKYAEHLAQHFKSYACDKCDKTFTVRKNFYEHKLKHNGVKYECEICSKKFTYKNTLQQHRRSHDKNFTDKTRICNICGKAYNRKHLLKKHMEKEHDFLELGQRNDSMSTS